MACHNSCAGGPHDKIAHPGYPGLTVGEIPNGSLPATERLKDLLDPILGRQLVQLAQLVRLVLWNQEQKLYRNCRVVPVCSCTSVLL